MRHNRMISENLRKHALGVTLLELMIVCVIIGTLSVIAVPAYRGYSMRAQRTEAKTALLRLAANQERFYLQNNTYTADFNALKMPGGLSEYGVYTIDFGLGAPDTLGYTARATPTAGGGTNGVNQSADTECAAFTIDAQGVKGASPDPNGRCW